MFRLSKNGKRVDYLEPNQRVRDRAKKYTFKDGAKGRRPHVKSNKVPPGSSDLSRATQQARHRNQDTSAKNYAAYRYIDKDGNEGILVGRSQGTHSERSAGSLLLDEMQKGNIRKVTEVYTERAPCSPNKGNCDEWLYAHFAKNDPNFKVSHSWNYDGTDGTNAQVSGKIRTYARGLLGR